MLCLWVGLAVGLWDADNVFGTVVGSLIATCILVMPVALFVAVLWRIADLGWYVAWDAMGSHLSVAILMLCLWAGLAFLMWDADAVFVSVVASFIAACAVGVPVALAVWLLVVLWRIGAALLAHRRGGMGRDMGRGDLGP